MPLVQLGLSPGGRRPQGCSPSCPALHTAARGSCLTSPSPLTPDEAISSLRQQGPTLPKGVGPKQELVPRQTRAAPYWGGGP